MEKPWVEQYDLIEILTDVRARSNNIQTLHKLSGLYFIHRTAFTNQLESDILKMIRLRTPAELYTFYKNVECIGVGDAKNATTKEPQTLVLDQIVNAFATERDQNFFIYFAKAHFEIKRDLLLILDKKAMYYNPEEFVAHAAKIQSLIDVPQHETICKHLLVHDYRFPTIFPILSEDLKYELTKFFINNKPFLSRIDSFLKENSSLKERITKEFVDDGFFAKAFITSDIRWRFFPNLSEIIFANKDKLTRTSESFLKNRGMHIGYDDLVWAANFCSKKKIFKIILGFKNDISKNKFLEQFQEDPEIKPFIAFV